VSVKFWVALPEVLVALNMIGYVPPVPAAGVPLRTPVVVLNVTPVGNVPVSLNVGAGVPVAITVNVPGVPTVNVVLLPLVITGAVFTVSVKLCVAGVPTVLLAVNVMEYVPTLPDAGVPLSVPVPSKLSLKVTPLGSAPASSKDGTGKPVVITVNDAKVPTVNVVALGLMMAGASSTVSVKLCVALVPTPLLAVKVMEYVLPVPAAGVPLSTPVPGLNVTPVGKAPVSLKVGVGVPVAVTVNVPAVPTVNVVVLPLVITGAVFTVSVKGWLAGVPTPLVAVKVMEYVPLVPAAGVPLSFPVPLPLSVKVTPFGSAPDSVRAGAGKPVVVTVKLPNPPKANDALLALVMAGA
jgi:hypothetical protein